MNVEATQNATVAIENLLLWMLSREIQICFRKANFHMHSVTILLSLPAIQSCDIAING
jgi:hypothetical protein